MFDKLRQDLRLLFRQLRKPVVTQGMKNTGLMWKWDGTYWIEVCDFCHGNCGQCGITGRVGNVSLDFNAMVTNLNKKGRK